MDRLNAFLKVAAAGVALAIAIVNCFPKDKE